MSITKEKFGEIKTIAASGEITIGVLEANKLDLAGIGASVDYNASGTGTARLKIYHSPDGSIEHKDTVEYAGFNLDLTAGSTVKKTRPFDLIDGYYFVTIKNNDATYTLTNVKVWVNKKYEGEEYQRADQQIKAEALRYKKEGLLKKEPVEGTE